MYFHWKNLQWRIMGKLSWHWPFLMIWSNIVELNSTYIISDAQLISQRNERKFMASHLTQIVQHDLKILEVNKSLLERSFLNSLVIYEKVVFDFINYNTLDEQLFY